MTLYHIEKVLTDDQLEDLYLHESSVGSNYAGVTPYGKNDDSNKPLKRRARIKKISHSSYPDICKNITELVKHLGVSSYDYEVREFNYLIYQMGDHFVKHQDALRNKDRDNRVFSSITLLNKSDDFSGGALVVYDGDKREKINLNVGETIIFRSDVYHEVEVVTSGIRKTLVAWIYEKK